MEADPAIQEPTPSKAEEEGFSATSVRKVIKSGTDVKAIAADAVAVLTKAVEDFLAAMVGQAADSMLEDGRKILAYKDVANVVERVQCLDFLEDIIPQKVTAAKYLQNLQQS